jgi:hypothetical protein
MSYVLFLNVPGWLLCQHSSCCGLQKTQNEKEFPTNLNTLQTRVQLPVQFHAKTIEFEMLGVDFEYRFQVRT